MNQQKKPTQRSHCRAGESQRNQDCPVLSPVSTCTIKLYHLPGAAQPCPVPRWQAPCPLSPRELLLVTLEGSKERAEAEQAPRWALRGLLQWPEPPRWGEKLPGSMGCDGCQGAGAAARNK